MVVPLLTEASHSPTVLAVVHRDGAVVEAPLIHFHLDNHSLYSSPFPDLYCFLAGFLLPPFPYMMDDADPDEKSVEERCSNASSNSSNTERMVKEETAAEVLLVRQKDPS